MSVKANIWISIVLVAINVVLFNLVFREVKSLRVDLTEGDVYSLSPVTERIVGELDEQVTIRGYFSKPENLHEDIRPFVPELLDLLEEYAARSDGKVEILTFDPDADSQVEEEAQNTYGLQPRAFAYREQNQSGVKSFYFGLAVSYAGGRPQTIDFPDLVEPGSIYDTEQKLSLKNVEFAITRAIKQTVYGFESERDVFSRLSTDVVVRTYLSDEDQLPEGFKEAPARARKVLKELSEASSGRVRFIDDKVPTQEEDQIALSRRYGIDPMGFPGSDKSFYLWASLEIDGQVQPFPLISIDGAPTEFALREDFEAIFRQLSPGSRHTIGIVQTAPPPANPMMGMQRPAPARFAALQNALADEYETRSLDPQSLNRISREIEVLIVPSPKVAYSQKAVFAIDQFVMRGGKAIFLVDRNEMNLQPQSMAITANPKETGLESLLAHWGVEVTKESIIDEGTRAKFFWPEASSAPGRQQKIAYFTWAALPLAGLESDTVNRDVAFLGGFELAGFWFPSALSTTKVEGLKTDWLLRSTKESWLLNPDSGVAPNPTLYPETGYARPADTKTKSRELAVLVEGEFPSYFASRPIPRDEPVAPEDETAEKKPLEDKNPGAPLKASPSTRVIVIGNDDWVENLQAGISRQYPEFGYFDQNANFMKDTIAWLLEDDDLSRIRNRARSFRPLDDLDKDEISFVQSWNFIVPLVLLGLLGLAVQLVRLSRRSGV